MKLLGSKTWIRQCQRRLNLFIAATLLFSGMTNAGRQQEKSFESELNNYLTELTKRLPVTPGLAVAVVRGEQIVFAQGFGYRDVKAIAVSERMSRLNII